MTKASKVLKESNVQPTETIVFTKDQLLGSQKWSQYRDLLDALLKEEEFYTMEEVNEKIKEFRKGKVK